MTSMTVEEVTTLKQLKEAINNTGISLLLVMGTDQDDVYDTLTEKFEELSNDTPQIDFWLVYGRLIEWDHNMLKLMPSVAETESHCIHAFKQNVNIKVEAFRGPDDIADVVRDMLKEIAESREEDDEGLEALT